MGHLTYKYVANASGRRQLTKTKYFKHVFCAAFKYLIKNEEKTTHKKG